MSRRALLGAALAFVALLTFLTGYVLVTSGPDVLVLASLVVLALVGAGVLGALRAPPEGD